jgi:hypothetical protein
LRPSGLPLAAKRRRGPSLNRSFLPTSSLSTRIFPRRYSMASC